MGLYAEKVLPRFDEIKKWRQEGQTEKNIAKLLGVSYITFCKYKAKHPQLFTLMDDSKELLIKNLETTMYQAALGKLLNREVKTITGADGKIRTDETIKELPPNTALLIFSLKNLAPDRWRDVQEVSNSGNVEVAIKNINKVSAELKEAIKNE